MDLQDVIETTDKSAIFPFARRPQSFAWRTRHGDGYTAHLQADHLSGKPPGKTVTEWMRKISLVSLHRFVFLSVLRGRGLWSICEKNNPLLTEHESRRCSDGNLRSALSLSHERYLFPNSRLLPRTFLYLICACYRIEEGNLCTVHLPRKGWELLSVHIL